MVFIPIIVGVILSMTTQITWPQEKPLYPGYPLSFDDRGHFDGLSGKKIIINDVGYKLASGATFNLPDYLNSGPSGFRIGDIVGVLLDSKGQVESVWLIKRSLKKK